MKSNCDNLEDCVLKVSSSYPLDKTKEKYLFLNTDAVKISYTDTSLDQVREVVHVFSLGGDNLFHFELKTKQQDLKTSISIFDQILSSFKFVGDTSEAVSGGGAWEKDLSHLSGVIMGENRDYVFSVFYPETWKLDKNLDSSETNTLLEGCSDYTITSPDSTILILDLICSTWTGSDIPLPNDYEVVKNMGKKGNDASDRILVRYPIQSSTTYQYGWVSIYPNEDQQISSDSNVSDEILVTYASDDHFFIPVNANVISTSDSDLKLVDQMVLKLLLSRE